jgi:predicted dehydrogenase
MAETVLIPESELISAVTSALPPRPKAPRPIVSIGAGGIVRAAHLPAYVRAGFPVIAVADAAPGKAAALARDFDIARSFTSVAEAIAFAPPDTVFDVAVPASQLLHILPLLPERATVLMQKPMGENLAEARAIRDLCRARSLLAAVNFSLRYSPNNLGAVALHQRGFLGEVHDLEIQTRTYTPWQLWTFLATAPRLEILYHSIHYLDLVRSWLGNPHGVYCKTVVNPQTPALAPTKSTIILDYGPCTRVLIATNHGHDFGDRYQHSFAQWEGTGGAARITLGLNLDYPRGKPDTLEYAQRVDPPGDPQRRWHALPVLGENFPDAFIGTMGALQAFAEGSLATLPSHFEDAFQTMALVEACYRISSVGETLFCRTPLTPSSSSVGTVWPSTC